MKPQVKGYRYGNPTGGALCYTEDNPSFNSYNAYGRINHNMLVRVQEYFLDILFLTPLNEFARNIQHQKLLAGLMKSGKARDVLQRGTFSMKGSGIKV